MLELQKADDILDPVRVPQKYPRQKGVYGTAIQRPSICGFKVLRRIGSDHRQPGSREKS